MNPELDNLKFDYGKPLEQMGKTDEAIAAYQDYIKAYPNDKNAYMNLGILYQKNNNPNYAISVLQKGVKVSSDFDIKNELAKSYFQNGEFQNALNIYEEELNVNSKNLRAAYNKGLCLEAMKQFKEADTIYRKLSYFEPSDLAEFGIKKTDISNSIYSNSVEWANSLVKEKDYRKAKEIYTAAVAENPENSKAYLGLAKTYEGLGAKTKVVESYEKAIQVAPTDKEVYKEYGKSLSSLNEEQTAQNAYKKAYELDNNDDDSLELLADSYTKTGNFESALELYQKSLEKYPNDADLYIKIGSMYKYLKDDIKAVENYNKALEINPSSENAYFNLGLCDFDKNDYDSAIKNFEKALGINPKYAFAYWGLGKCFEKKQNKDNAIYYYEKFIEVSDNPELKKQAELKIKTLYEGLVDWKSSF